MNENELNGMKLDDMPGVCYLHSNTSCFIQRVVGGWNYLYYQRDIDEHGTYDKLKTVVFVPERKM